MRHVAYTLSVSALLLVRFSCQLAAALLTVFLIIAALLYAVLYYRVHRFVPSGGLSLPVAALISAVVLDDICGRTLALVDRDRRSRAETSAHNSPITIHRFGS